MCGPKSPKCIAKMAVAVSFGVALALFGLAHFMDMAGFAEMAKGGFSGPLASLAGLWAYILPLLMVVGGVLIVVGYRPDVAAWCAGIALASIAIGMPLKAVLGSANLGDVAPAANNALLWLLVYWFVIKGMCCGSCDSSGGGNSGGGGGGHM